MRTLLIAFLVSAGSVLAHGQSAEPPEPNLKDLATAKLLQCFSNWRVCGTGNTWDIADELASRKITPDLMARYWRDRDPMIRNGIERALYGVDAPEVTAFMRRIIKERVDDYEDRYFPINYLAKKCDPHALKELGTGRYRNQGSMQYESSVVLFGKCGYRPAIPYLINCLYDFSLNIVGGAETSLLALYPNAPRRFKTLEAEQRYFCGRARRDGYIVHCD